MLRITGFKIVNYGGITELEAQIPPAGALIIGRCGGGKTSVLDAVRAALAGRGIGPDAIKNGTDRSEVLVDMDDLHVRQLITARNATVTVKRDGETATIKQPRAFLSNLLGTSAIDPIDIIVLKPKERRAAVLNAMGDVTVTLDDMRRWVPDLPAEVTENDLAGHGLDVVAAFRDAYYEKRTVANATAKKSADEAERAKVQAEADKTAAGPACTVPVAEAQKNRENAQARERALHAQREAAKASVERTTKARARVAELRTKAVVQMERPSDLVLEAANEAVEAATREVERLEHALAVARETKQRCVAEQRDAALAHVRYEQALDAATAADTQANEIEATIAETVIEDVTDDALAEAAEHVLKASQLVDHASLQAKADASHQRHAELAEAARDAKKAAEAIDKVVQRLTDDAPAELLKRSNGIPGLTVRGDDLLLDGVPIDRLCGAQKMKFAVDVARRANPQSRILIVDGLERLDPDLLETFVRFATADGYQLLGTRVDRGDMRIDAIDLAPVEEKGAAAQ